MHSSGMSPGKVGGVRLVRRDSQLASGKASSQKKGFTWAGVCCSPHLCPVTLLCADSWQGVDRGCETSKPHLGSSEHILFGALGLCGLDLVIEPMILSAGTAIFPHSVGRGLHFINIGIGDLDLHNIYSTYSWRTGKNMPVVSFMSAADTASLFCRMCALWTHALA